MEKDKKPKKNSANSIKKIMRDTELKRSTIYNYANRYSIDIPHKKWADIL